LSVKSEKEFIKIVEGARRVAMSGAGDTLGDLKAGNYLIQEKTSDKSVSINVKLLDKTEAEARRELREPMLLLNIRGRRLLVIWL